MAITELPKNYDAASAEKDIYRRWEESGYFNPDNLPRQDGDPFTIMMPPPNVTGVLHAGHAMFLTIQDIFIRHARMQGKRTLWLPGTDHAAIATQAKVEKEISKKEKKSRHDLGREELLRRVNEFALASQSTILSQMRAMGSSCDWSRLAYTLDETRSRAVNEAFKRLHGLGLIYRGHRIVNWDPKGQTTISDDEIVYQEEKTTFYYFRYGPFVIGTARPETKFGDKYVVVHPDDPRYAQYAHGQKLTVEWINGPIEATVIKDNAIDMEFGTGAMTITPWHSTADFDIAERHGLDKEQIIDERGKLLDIAGEFTGMKIAEARPKIVEKLRAKGLVVKEEEYVHQIATAERTGGIVEPQIKLQWFIAVNQPFTLEQSAIPGIASGQEITLKQLMQHVVRDGHIRIVPDRFANNYFHWIDNLRDWCISRQIWFGHRVPVWYRGDELAAGDEPSGDGWTQDPDTLDTWFSSGLWTFSTLGWPDETPDLRTFHPTDVMETAYEILFFWVARMILMTGALLGDVPFRTVYLHGLVRDEKRAKLSKSKSDSADPLDLIGQYGTDALRMALIFNTSPGTDSILSNEKIKGMKHFANKLWNIARYVLANVPSMDSGAGTPDPATDADRAILAKLDETVGAMSEDLEAFRIHEAAQRVYQFAWHEFADIYLEASKSQLDDIATAGSTRNILAYCLDRMLRLLHPFMPFVTEELWGRIHGTDDPAKLLMVQSWPAASR
ncbi:MAG TPA: valine--tRNA ligase [Candidatus Paceibacterota bacterium]|nr:valine--tRNA ligase [Candidatus Paceibacterota bacterium]